MNLLKQLEKEGVNFLEHLNRVDVLNETWSEIDLLGVLLNPKYDDSRTSNSKELFRRPFRHNK